jgi:branched-chain amino acid transport system permease protein
VIGILATGGWFASNEVLIQTALVAALLGFSFQVALRSGVYTFAGVGCWAIGGYASAILIQRGWAVVPAVTAACALAAVTGIVLALILGRLRSLYLAMATLAFTLLVQILAGTLDITGGQEGLYGVPIVVGTGALVATVAVCAVILALRERGRSGRTLEAMRVDERLAGSLGVSLVRQRIVAFALSAVLGAIAGAMNILLFGSLTPDQAGFDLLVTTLTIVVVGGISSWCGPVLGAIVVTWLPDLLGFLGDWWPAVQGALIVVTVLFAPDGIAGLLRSLFVGVRRRWRPLSPTPVPSLGSTKP